MRLLFILAILCAGCTVNHVTAHHGALVCIQANRAVTTMPSLTATGNKVPLGVLP